MMGYAAVVSFVLVWAGVMELLDAKWEDRRLGLKSGLLKLAVSAGSSLYGIAGLALAYKTSLSGVLDKRLGAVILIILLSGLIWLLISSPKTRLTDLQKTTFRTLVLLLLAAVLLELTLFNFRTYESFLFKPIDQLNLSTTSAIVDLGDGWYEIDEESEEKPDILISDIGQPVDNIYIDIDPEAGLLQNGEEDSFLDSHIVKVVLSAADEANAKAFYMPEVDIADDVEDTKYIRTHLSGNVDSITIRLNNLKDRAFKIKGIHLNQTVPFQFSLWRILVLYIILAGFALLRPKSFLYKRKLDFGVRWQGNAIVITLAVLMILLVLLSSLNPRTNGQTPSQHRFQYEVFAERLAEGHLTFDYPVDEALAAMENPYDPSARSELGVRYMWDHAFYNGQYYMYFGIVPELLLFLPFYLLTGDNLPTYIAIAFFEMLIAAGFLALFYRTAKQWFQHVKFPVYYLISVAAILGSGMTFAKYPSVYTIPIACAVALGIWGLYFWIRSLKPGDHLDKWSLLSGSILIALVFGCRPQVGLVFLLSVPIFWNALVKDRQLFSKKGILNTVLLLLPFVLVAAGLMWYNAARFGSPFDFGAQYNLTTNDMTRRGFVIDRIPEGLFAMFAQLPIFVIQFPFFHRTWLNSTYQGKLIHEATFGGVLWTFPILLVLPFGFARRQELKQRGVYGIFSLAVAVSVIISIVDVEVAGILQRYIHDFSWILFFAASLVIYTLTDREAIDRKTIWTYRLFAVAAAISIIYGLLFFFFSEASSYSAEYAITNLYHSVANLIEFWK